MKVTCRIEKGNKVWRNEKGQIHRDNEPAVECCSGDKEWFQNDKLHRIDGAAIESANGYKEWRQNGLLHRIGAPAIEYPNGDKSWWKNGKLNRTDGPAMDLADGYKEWWIEGKEYSEEEFNKLTNNSNEINLSVMNPTDLCGYPNYISSK
jgi:hypothetical protein